MESTVLEREQATALNNKNGDRGGKYLVFELGREYPKTPRLAIRRRYGRRIGGRPRFRWVDVRPVAIMADIPVGRHDLLDMGYPDYMFAASESPVHNERCTPGSGAEGEP